MASYSYNLLRLPAKNSSLAKSRSGERPALPLARLTKILISHSGVKIYMIAVQIAAGRNKRE